MMNINARLKENAVDLFLLKLSQMKFVIIMEENVSVLERSLK